MSELRTAEIHPTTATKCRQDTHSQHTYVQYSSQARNASHALGSSHTGCSVIFVRLKRICHLVCTCLTRCCFLTCRLPRARPLPHSLFLLPRHKNTQHDRFNMIISKNTQSTSSAIRNHSGVKTCRVAETRGRHLPQVMSPRSLRLSQGSKNIPEIQINFFDVQEKCGEQDHPAPITEEVKEFGENATANCSHSLPDSKISEMSCFQSQMHFDDSVESTADSDLEDGELQKMLTSPLYAQKASEKPDALVVQERERGKCALDSCHKRKFEVSVI